MRIGIISNTDAFIPLAYTLASHKMQVYIFYAPSPDMYINQKVTFFVKQLNLPFTEEKDHNSDIYHWISSGNYDGCFIIGYKHLVNLDKLKQCPTFLFNIHFGPLPAFRGPMPVFWQLKQGIKKLGMAIHILSAEFDKGQVVWLKEVDNASWLNYQSVNQLFNQLCLEGVLFILRLLMNKMPLPAIEKQSVLSSYQKRPTLKDITIHWQQMTADQIVDLIRACNPWNKGAATVFEKREIKIMDAFIVNGCKDQDNPPGTIVEDDTKLWVVCSDLNILHINMLYNDFFIPTYQCRHWGIIKGKRFG